MEMEWRDGIRVHIRWMIRRDMPEVLEANADYQGERWEEEEFLQYLRARNCIGMVAEHGESVIGFMVYELCKNKLEVLRLAVHPGYPRRGVGRQLLAKLQSKLSSHRRNRIGLEVWEGNLGAQLFLKKCDFRCVAVKGEQYRFVYRVPTEVNAMHGVEMKEEMID